MAAERIDQAERRLAYAEQALAEGNFNIAAELAVTAGINLSDAICCLGAGEHVQGGAHEQALDLLARVDREAAKVLRRLLAVKTQATYGGPMGHQHAQQAVRNARQMMALTRVHMGS